MYCEVGSEVTVLDSGPALLEHGDDDVADVVRAVLDKVLGVAQVVETNRALATSWARCGSVAAASLDAVPGCCSSGRRSAQS